MTRAKNVALVPVDEPPLDVTPEVSGAVSMFERLARDPGASVEKIGHNRKSHRTGWPSDRLTRSREEHTGYCFRSSLGEFARG